MQLHIKIVILCGFIISTYASDYKFYANVSKYYKFHREPKVWHQAVHTCKTEKSTLAMPRNAAEVSVLNGIFSGYPSSILNGVTHRDYILLGFHDIFQEGEYITLNGGESIQYYFHKWGGNQPDNANNEDCGSLHRAEVINDFPCGVPAVFICEKSDLIPDTEFSNCGTTDLAYKYSYELNMCYKLHLNPRVWSMARAICEAEGGNLAIIRSKAEEEYLVKMFNDPDNIIKHVIHKDYALIGFHDMYAENYFLTVLDENLHDVGYINWLPNQPDNAGGNENCGSMHSSGGINDFPCSVPAVYFCQKQTIKLDIRFNKVQ